MWLTDIAERRPLGPQSEPLMTGHDIVCLHTMVGFLASTRGYFAQGNGPGYRGTESHFGVGGRWGADAKQGLHGHVDQWQDLRYQADANLNGGPRVISVETADNAPARAVDIEPWTDLMLDVIARLLVRLCARETHAQCPPSWTCHQVGIPLALIPDTKPGRRGIGWHAQGVPGNGLVPGGVKWSDKPGKECPGPARIRQMPELIRRARALAAGASSPPEDDMPWSDTEWRLAAETKAGVDALVGVAERPLEVERRLQARLDLIEARLAGGPSADQIASAVVSRLASSPELVAALVAAGDAAEVEAVFTEAARRLSPGRQDG